MSESTKHDLRRLPDIDPDTIHAAMREAHRLRAQTACALFTAAAAGMSRLWVAALAHLTYAPRRRTRTQLR